MVIRSILSNWIAESHYKRIRRKLIDFSYIIFWLNILFFVIKRHKDLVPMIFLHFDSSPKQNHSIILAVTLGYSITTIMTIKCRKREKIRKKRCNTPSTKCVRCAQNKRNASELEFMQHEHGNYNYGYYASNRSDCPAEHVCSVHCLIWWA